MYVNSASFTRGSAHPGGEKRNGPQRTDGWNVDDSGPHLVCWMINDIFGERFDGA